MAKRYNQDSRYAYISAQFLSSDFVQTKYRSAGGFTLRIAGMTGHYLAVESGNLVVKVRFL